MKKNFVLQSEAKTSYFVLCTLYAKFNRPTKNKKFRLGLIVDEVPDTDMSLKIPDTSQGLPTQIIN